MPRWLLVLGFVGALAYWLENGWQSWSAVHLERTLDASPATLIGSLTTLMYLGFLVGPAAVGRLADATTLRTSLGGLAALSALLAILVAVIRFPSRA